jgi:hypothetical protein
VVVVVVVAVVGVGIVAAVVAMGSVTPGGMIERPRRDSGRLLGGVHAVVVVVVVFLLVVVIPVVLLGIPAVVVPVESFIPG